MRDALVYDVAVVGGGIVGLSTARALLRSQPSLRLVVLEKENKVGAHQTGHNSGVIHGGIYYRPGSLKARLCIDGARQLVAFCDEHNIPYERCGKVIVATDERELAALDQLFERGAANGVPGLRKIGPEELREIEPFAAGLGALHSPSTGIVDYGQVAQAMAADLTRHGAAVVTGAQVRAIHLDGQALRLETTAGEVPARRMINCAGLYSDVIARKMGINPDVQNVPFRGEYYFVRPERRSLVRGLIYPVPDPRLPFLGVHFTRTIHGEVEAGPNAVLAFAREGYTKGRIHLGELGQVLAYPGFWALARRYWKTGVYEYYRSFSRRAFVRSLQRLLPEIRCDDVVAGGAGVRAQAVTRDGSLVDDFRIVQTREAVHVLNAPSPAATASIAIGTYIAHLTQETFEGP